MADSLKGILQGIPAKYINELSTEDLIAINEDRTADVSTSALEIISQGNKDLGMLEFLDIGGALAGAGAGAAIGTAVLPGIGTAIGTVMGGAIGTFAGEVTEDLIAEREVNLGFREGGAAREAAISGALDTFTLGAGKGIRAYKAYRATRPSLQELGSEFDSVLKLSEAAADSPEALAQAQKLLQEQGQSLSPLATESATMAVQIGRELGEMGLLSRPIYEADVAKSQEIVLDIFTNFSNSALAKNPEEIGKTVIALKSSADRAMHTIYGRQLDSLSSIKAAKKFTSTKPVVDALENFKKKFETEGFIPFEGKVSKTNLDSAAEKFVNQEILSLTGSVNNRYAKFSLSGLIALDKKINNEIANMIPGGAYGNGTARGQLKELHKSVRDAIIKPMRAADPALAKVYQKMQKEYADGLDFLDLSTVENLIKNGVNKESYQAIGRGLIAENDPEKIKNLMKVAERSIRMLKKTNPKMDTASRINEFRETIRASFLKESQYTREAAQGKTKAISNIFGEDDGAMQMLAQESRIKAMMGERFPAFKQALNHVVAMSKKRNQQTFSLAMRSAELGAVGALAAGAVGTAAGFASVGLGSMAVAGAILASPIFLYKLTSKPGLVNKFIALDNQMLKKSKEVDPKQLSEIAVSNLSKLLAELSDEDIMDVKQSISDPNYTFGR